MIEEAPPRKLDFAPSTSRVPRYASLYRFGGAATPRPVIVYVGGAISLADYLARRSTHPEPVAACLRAAVAASRLRALDALICPCPLGLGPDGPDGFVEHYDRDLVPALGAAPSALGCVGYSAGAAIAAHLAIVAGARAAACYGGVGVTDAVHALTPLTAAATAPELGLFRNRDDLVPDPATVARALGGASALRPVVHAARPGGHPFVDYAANGTVTAAFRFVIERLSDETEGAG